ncbi:MAG TPA: sterol desaturase family protein [Ignavibacteria bacterium]|nr:sterol desaturase family protein [Ignavibacteria bacterium]
MDLQTISYIIVGGSAVLMVILERLFPYTKGQKLFREGFFYDFILYTVVQSYLLGLIIFGLLNWIKADTDLYKYSVMENLGIPIWAQFLFFFVTHDLYIYWFHRWQHNNSFLWRTHEAHHSPRTVDWLSGSRSHALEILINQTVEFAPIILLGAAPEIAIMKGTVDAVWGMFIHSNIDVRLGKLQYFINGPEMHRWHHSDDEGREYQNNYGTKLAIWDWMFGTAFYPNPDERKPIKYGLSDTPDYPLSHLTWHDFKNMDTAGKDMHNAAEANNRRTFGGRIVHFFKVIFIDSFVYLKQHLFAFRSFKDDKYVGE